MSDQDYNNLLLQVSINLNNTLNTWGASSHQYQEVLQTLKALLQRIQQRDAQHVMNASVDPDMLSQAMEFLKLG